ncbi:unnamed protein product [Lactuca virosa]|uniref:Uncharacterized protein n=1 Tax=Lactuca virosa TaxID=75947 RepID=A0AAU9NBG3_9ASTR|nr:unnamed protein product [Lactuca virosa]
MSRKRNHDDASSSSSSSSKMIKTDDVDAGPCGACKTWRSVALSNWKTFMASKSPMVMRISTHGRKRTISGLHLCELTLNPKPKLKLLETKNFPEQTFFFPKLLGFMLLALIWKFDFPPFMALIIAILNDGTIMTISKDRVKPSPLPDSWTEIFAIGIILGSYLSKDRVKPSPLPDN